MIDYLSFPTSAATTDGNGLRWDDTAGSYRCPTCTQTPRTLAVGPVEALVCSDCATYWLTPTATGRQDLEGVEDVYRAAGCLDSDLTDSGSDTALDGTVSAAARAA
ncbi:hypothetical protein [Pseudonocardia sp. ICBG601]|uniref:hypothetical protein n=1 Tax=Pseudonocardia sp. ICBG601 TaxID=2846759 RepID=UPI001CF65A0B|nr:hypothetical protein [Pseudonocardia sp. ICBG601]